MEKLEDKAVRKLPVGLGPAGRGVGEEVNLCLTWGRCCLYSSRSAAAAFSPRQGRHFSVLVAHLMDLVLSWELLCFAGTPTGGA